MVRGPAALVLDFFKLDVGQLMPRHVVSREAVHHCHVLLGHLDPATPVRRPRPRQGEQPDEPADDSYHQPILGITEREENGRHE